MRRRTTAVPGGSSRPKERLRPRRPDELLGELDVVVGYVKRRLQ